MFSRVLRVLRWPLGSARVRKWLADAALVLTGLIVTAVIIGSLYYLLEPTPYRHKFWAIVLLIFLPLLLYRIIKVWRRRRKAARIGNRSFITQD